MSANISRLSYSKPYEKSPEYSLKENHLRSSSLTPVSPSPYNQNNVKECVFPKPKPSRCAAADLRRKMVFVLHDEIKLSPSVVYLEEISDMNRITDICMSNLKSMMETKKYRKHLHHMNNNALTHDPNVFSLLVDT